MRGKAFLLGTLILCLVLQVTGQDEDDNPLINHYADYESVHPSEYFSSGYRLSDGTQVIVEAINELQGIKRPKAGFHCVGSKKLWTKSLPGDRFFAKFLFYRINPKARWVHRCHFRSNLGYANVNIVVTPALGRSCPDYRCILAIRKEGLLMKDTKELTPWNPWPRRLRQPFNPGGSGRGRARQGGRH
ncbi:PREDICTED: uncharacterized protein LOC104811312 [Tarenaya hassleriana]|uniref:uncharacterized protein LOC104811312 n=1 Tax=Tarenaya hassleriana TaxID=28532 RepID=UPI00053C0C92|nr:PREDICTED: uncharacterized protein LOC104811312 [Tarenaya hassleriana]